MFIGHYAVALGAKRVAPRLSLGTLFLASQLVDLLWPLFLLIGIEHVRIDPGNTAVTPLDFYDYPYTHSLIGAIAWSVLAGAITFAVRKHHRGAWVVGAVVFSHWILDLITHRPDLPLGAGTQVFFGLGLWNSVAGTVAVEAGLFVLGVSLYYRATRARDKIGSVGFWTLILLLILIYAANLAGPPPPGASAIAIAGNAAWLFVIWAYWVDRHRTFALAADATRQPEEGGEPVR
jgi:hypothetical protein